MTYFLIVIRQIAQFILFAGIGVIAAKTNIITRENIGMLSKLVVRIALPLYIFTNTITSYAMTTKSVFQITQETLYGIHVIPIF